MRLRSSFLKQAAVLAPLMLFAWTESAAQLPRMAPTTPFMKIISARGRISIDAPWKVKPDLDFNLDVWWEGWPPLGASDSLPAPPVFFEQTDKISYDPRVVNGLTPGIRKTVKVRVQKSRSGLVEIIATAAGHEALSLTLDAGADLAPRVALDGTLRAFSTAAFTVDVINSSGTAVPIDAPLSLVLQASQAQVQVHESGWQKALEIPLQRGSTSTPLVQIRSQSWSPATAVLKAELRMNQSLVLASITKTVSIVPSWWISLVMSVFGGLCYGVYRVVAKSLRGTPQVSHWRRSAKELLATAAAGAVAYLLASWDVLGIKVDTTSLRGFVVIGFLFAYVGVEAVLQRIVPKKDGAV